MKVTVCQLNKSVPLETTWNKLIRHVKNKKSEFVLLPEMPFYNWLCKKEKMDLNEWEKSVAAHDKWISRFEELSVPVIASSRPVIENGLHYNEGYIWTKDRGYIPVHRKVYLPNEKCFWEANWYQPGPKEFKIVEYNNIKMGFLICSEMWFLQHAREYSKKGVHILVCPRSTYIKTKSKWVHAGIASAVVSGAFAISSNFSGQENALKFAGMGWVIEPEDGKIIKTTDLGTPFVTVNIDLSQAEKAKNTYPRYVKDEF